MSFLLTLIAFLLILGVLVFIHELGHFAVAKWMGMKVDEFAIGFPPRIWSKRKGETLYSLNAIPFGGYVKIHGETPESQDEDPRSFEQKSVWARMAVIVAGVTMNVLFAFVILTVAFSVGFVSISQDLEQVPGATKRQTQVLVADIQEGGGADKAGVKPGDLIKGFVSSEDGAFTEVTTVAQLTAYTKTQQELGISTVKISLNRNGELIETTAEIAKEGPPLGVYIQPFSTVRVPVWQAPIVAVKEIGAIIAVTWDALAGFWNKLFFSAQLDPNVSGPVGIYQATGSATQAGAISTIFLIVALSLNLALLNILPIPALDGGKLLFLIIEAIIGKKRMNRRLESAITFAGFVMLIGLILILSVRDVIRLF
ncbi:MAG TPA: site-2 protease family protein [Verrucomicrobiae bacterium]|nr:site-2 protease family protein [Verrucomicrobiae bacterium]